MLTLILQSTVLTSMTYLPTSMDSVMEMLSLPMMSRLPLLQLEHLATLEDSTMRPRTVLLVTLVGDRLAAQLLLQAGLRLEV